MEELLDETFAVAKAFGVLKMSYLEQLYVDTTVQEKNIAYPSETNLLYRAMRNLVGLAKGHDIELRQTYTRVSKGRKIMAHRYAAALQYNRGGREIKKLKTLLGRVIRHIERKVDEQRKPFLGIF